MTYHSSIYKRYTLSVGGTGMPKLNTNKGKQSKDENIFYQKYKTYKLIKISNIFKIFR